MAHRTLREFLQRAACLLAAGQGGGVAVASSCAAPTPRQLARRVGRAPPLARVPRAARGVLDLLQRSAAPPGSTSPARGRPPPLPPAAAARPGRQGVGRAGGAAACRSPTAQNSAQGRAFAASQPSAVASAPERPARSCAAAPPLFMPLHAPPLPLQGCFSDCGTCCCGYWCHTCQYGSVASDIDESASCCGQCCIYWCAVRCY